MNKISKERWDELLIEREIHSGYINVSHTDKFISGWHYEDYASGRMTRVLEGMRKSESTSPFRYANDIIFNFFDLLGEEEMKLKLDLLQEALDL